MDGTLRQVRRFVVIGAIGFVVDGGLLVILTGWGGLNPYIARCISFPAAVTMTWFLNRKHTFAAWKNSRAGAEWTRYTVVNTVGAGLNMGVYVALLFAFPALAAWPIVPLAIAAPIALAWNFTASRRLAFGVEQS